MDTIQVVCRGVASLDAELNLLQEWGACLSTEQPYAKAANFLEKFLSVPLWDSALEEIVSNSSINVGAFYKTLATHPEDLENQLLVATVDCKGVLMRKSELEKKETTLPKYRRLTRLGEKDKKPIDNSEIQADLKDGKKKMSCVTAVYEISRNVRTAETILAKHNRTNDIKKTSEPRTRDKIVYGTLNGKQVAFEQLKNEVSRT